MMKTTFALCAVLLLTTPALATVGSAPATTPEDGETCPASLFTALPFTAGDIARTETGAAETLPLSVTGVLTPFSTDTPPAYIWGVCSQSCQPCTSDSQCPAFLGLPQKCMTYCP